MVPVKTTPCILSCSGTWGQGNWAMGPHVVLKSLTTLGSTSENDLKPFDPVDTLTILRRVVKSKIGSLIREGPDRRPSAYTPLGPLRRQQSEFIGCPCHQSVKWQLIQYFPHCHFDSHFRTKSKPSSISPPSNLFRTFQVSYRTYQIS